MHSGIQCAIEFTIYKKVILAQLYQTVIIHAYFSDTADTVNVVLLQSEDNPYILHTKIENLFTDQVMSDVHPTHYIFVKVHYLNKEPSCTSFAEKLIPYYCTLSPPIPP